MQISIRPGSYAHNVFPAFPQPKSMSQLQQYNSILINIYLETGYTESESTLLMKPTEGKMDWHLHILQLLPWMSNQEENVQVWRYEQWDTRNIMNRQNTTLNLFEHIV